MATGTPSAFRVLLLIAGGALMGAAVTCTGLSNQQHANQFYTSHLEFRPVIQDGPDADQQERLIDSQIRLAESLIHTREFLEEVIKSPEFHRRADGAPGDAAWTSAHKGNEVAALQQDLGFVRNGTIRGFEISMRGPVAAETTSLLTGAGRVLQERLHAARQDAAENRLKTLADARGKAATARDVARESLASWARTKEVDVQRTRYEVEKSALQQRTEEAIRRKELGDVARAERADTERQQTANTVLAIGEALMEYQQKADDLKSKEALARSIQKEIETSTTNLSADIPHFEMGAPSAPVLDASQ